MPAKKRVLIIALDGFTWKLARGFLDRGIMGNLSKLVRQGSHGNLRSVIPFETSPAWSSFQTGCLPGKTKVFAFHTYDRNSKKVHLNSFSNIAVPSIWELATEAGKTVVSLNMPVTSPPPKVNGVIIPGLLCPQLSPETLYPAEAYAKYIEPRKDYMIVNHDWRETVAQFTEQAIATERVRCEVALELMNDIDWDLFSVQMQSSDTLQHKIWWALDSESDGYSQESNDEAMEFYRYCDEIIGKLIDSAGPETLTMIVSDHGFCMKKGDVGINAWLKQNGYLEFVSKPASSGFAAAKDRLKEKVPAAKLLARMYGSIQRSISGTAKNVQKPGSTRVYAETLLAHMRTYVDFEKTRAFCLGGMAGMLYINGTQEQREQLANEISAKLMSDFGPKSDNPVISSITPAAETYNLSGKPDFLPDLVIEPADGYELRISPSDENIIAPGLHEGKQQGTHNRDGVFVIHGPGVQEGSNFDADIIDIAPTALAYLQTAVPRQMDGKVLNAAFSKPLSVTYADVNYGDSGSANYSDAEQAEVEKHLSDLGYM